MSRFVALFIFVCSLAQAQIPAAPAPSWTSGKNIYQRGHANQPACATCHGIVGEGGQEGGQRAPALKWEWLSNQQSLFGRDRPGYNAAVFARAVMAGVDSSGRQFSSVMPKYALSPAELASLQKYLTIIESANDSDDGVTDTEILIGAALPLTGRLQDLGRLIQHELLQAYQLVNNNGGVYGRQLRLIVRDTRSESTDELAATQALVGQDRVFLLVGSFFTKFSGVEAWLENQATPLIGPVTLASLKPGNSGNIFYVLPSMADQGRVLARQALAIDEKNRACKQIALWAEDEPYALNAMEGAQRQLRAEGVEPHTAIVSKANSDKPAADPLLQKASIDCVLFFGAAEEMALLAKHSQTPVRWFGLVALLGHGVLALPRSIRHDLIVVQPLQEEAQAHEPLILLARTAAQLLVEMLKRSGRNINHTKVLSELKMLKDFRLDGLPPLSFGNQRRNGLQGAAVLKWNDEEKRYVKYHAWREAQ